MTTPPATFEGRLEPHRRELLAYCYRMLGSVHDAEDLVQDTFLRAWRARDSYDESRASLRTWLYRIATNVCLTALEGRARRPLPSGLVSESEPLAPLVRGEVPWLEPLPDALLGADDPADATVARAGLRLAFASALQHLSARERGALVLRDVLAFSAAESAEVLGTTTAAVNSALQRARAGLLQAGAELTQASEPSAVEQRAWLDRYTAAFVRADVEDIKALLTEDVLMEMPPMVNWFTGRDGYGQFMEWVYDVGGTDWCTVPVAANGQPGFAAYRRDGDGYALHTLQVLTVTADGVSRNSTFQDPGVFASFALPPHLDETGVAV